MRRLPVAAGMLLMTACATGLVGCSNPISMASTAGKAAFKAVRGAQAEVTPIRLASAANLAAFETLEMGEVTTDVPPICTPKEIDKVRQGLRKGMPEKDVKKAFPGGGQTLRMEVSCRFCKAGGTLGGEGRLDWLVTLKSAAGEEIGVLFVEGVSESPVEHGVGDMAEENAHELLKFLTKYRKKR